MELCLEVLESTRDAADYTLRSGIPFLDGFGATIERNLTEGDNYEEWGMKSTKTHHEQSPLCPRRGEVTL